MATTDHRVLAYNQNPNYPHTTSSSTMSLLLSIVSNGVSFGAEVYSHHTNKQAAGAQSSSSSLTLDPQSSASPSASRSSGNRSESNGSEKSENVEEILWELDEASQDAPSDSYAQRAMVPKGIGKDPARIPILVDAFVSVYQPVLRRTPAILPAAVIIPQRRPEARERGFVRAYAPCLAEAGVSENAFMQFHDFYAEALKFSNIIKVITVAAGITSFVPSAAAMAVSMAVGAAARAAGSLQSRQRTNDFMSQINAAYFIPMGLVCVVMKYKTPQSFETGTLDYAYASATQARHGNYGSANGQMDDSIMPVSAPLVFPELKQAPIEGKMSGFRRAGRFIANYSDRRAQAQFAMKNPDSQLAQAMDGQIKFESKFGDPRQFSGFSRPSLNSSFKGAMSGQTGSVSPLQQIGGGFQQHQYDNAYLPPQWPPSYGNSADDGSLRHEEKRSEEKQQQLRRGERHGRLGSSRSDGRSSILGKLKKKDVLYMMIVPVPTQEEMGAFSADPPSYMEMENVEV